MRAEICVSHVITDISEYAGSLLVSKTVVKKYGEKISVMSFSIADCLINKKTPYYTSVQINNENVTINIDTDRIFPPDKKLVAESEHR